MNINRLNWAVVFLLLFLVGGLTEEKIISHQQVNLHFVTNLDAGKILSSVDEILLEQQSTAYNILWFGSDNPAVPEYLKSLTSRDSDLVPLWHSTAMVFGAAANGVGVGTTFAIKKAADGQMIFMTNFHVVEQFCRVPQDVFSDRVAAGSSTYSCQALYVLHDVAINTQTNSAVVDGSSPWKSEILSLEYFDKKLDLAAFRIKLPEQNDLVPVTMELNYDLKRQLPSVQAKKAEKIFSNTDDTSIDAILDRLLITEATLFEVAYTMPSKDSQESVFIKKQWFKGAAQELTAYENEKKLGFVRAWKNSIEVLPGASGGPVALSDGRVIGISTGVELKQYYARPWWFFGKKRLKTSKSYFAMPAPYLKDLISTVN